MQAKPKRQSVDLSAYPDLVMVLLGFQVQGWRGVPALLRIGRGLRALRDRAPDGLLWDQQFIYGWNHVGIRQYWRDPDSLERFTRAEPHSLWWRDFLRDAQNCGFWHEAYHARGGVEAIYVNLPRPGGLAAFAPERAPVGPFMTSRDRVRADAEARRPAA
ncbi:hypothetical protein NS226_12510 [Aureimonas ureilytica]|uniref:Uncharacterized protein n=1 Tax=Aureimonas ureilytica TaxID=401562 RepID=A0A175R9N6_9HYPH|nr:DUF4188 domain-containing protein [Aureimonas ureilytica]KTQ95351.1 hypothetical protein NS226_12510 [Aureimonas ureilytica]